MLKFLLVAVLMLVTTVSAAPCWYGKAEGEVGTAEIVGSRHNPRVVGYATSARLGWNNDELPWCAAFVGAMLERCNIRSTRSGMARSYSQQRSKFTKINTPVLGCIVVFSRGTNPVSGHVGFYAGRSGSRIRVLGGNQGNRVKVANYSASRLIGFYWPVGQPRDSSGSSTPANSDNPAQVMSRRSDTGSDTNGSCTKRGFTRHMCRTSAGCSAAGGTRRANKGCPGRSSHWMCCVTSGSSSSSSGSSLSRRGFFNFFSGR